MGYFHKDRSRSLDPVLDPSVPSGVKPGEVVVDYGCGAGCYSWSMARGIGPEGRLLAVDIDPGVLDFISFVAGRRGIPQVETVLASRESPNLKNSSVDRIFLIDVYNVLAGIDLLTSSRPGPRVISTMQRLVNALRKGGHHASPGPSGFQA
jgi:precorrin-6B methylase 2